MTVRIRYSCPHCERRIEHNAALAGQLVVCSACKGEFYEPTDPLPGKSAEKALKPKPEEPRTIRFPAGTPGIDNQLAILSPQGSSGMQSIEQIVEAVLLGNGTTKPASAPMAALTSGAKPASAPFGAAATVPKTPAPAPGSITPSTKPSVPAALPPSAARPASRPAPQTPPQKPAAVHKAPIPVEGLAGVSAKQMIDELRRRGLFAVLLTAEAGNATRTTLIHSENMTDEDATSLVTKYVVSLQPEDKKPMKSGIMGRMFGGEK